MRENRQHRRTAAVIKVNYSSHGALKMDYAQNISKGGLFLATNNTFEIGQDIEIHLNSHGLPQAIPVPGKVRWIGERGTPSVRGIGIQFSLEDRKVREKIETMLSRIDSPENIFEEHSQKGIKIYILDPNHFAAQMYATGIQKMAKRGEGDLTDPISIVCFENIDKFQEVMHQKICDVLITELKTKDLDGIHLIRKLRLIHGDKLPIFAVSRPFPRDRDEALEAGASAFLNKPLQMRTLFNTLLICLQDIQ